MSKSLSRRQFMNAVLGAGVGAYGLALSPRSAGAQAGGFRVLVRIELLGGCDPHALWLPLDGSKFNALAARRSQAMFATTPGGALNIGFGHDIGLHPELAPIIPHIPKTKFFLNTSNDRAKGQTGSHERAQNIMTIGTQNLSGLFRGWASALYENDPGSRLMAFLGAHGANTNCDPRVARCIETPPPTVDTFETFRFDGHNFNSTLGGADNTAYVANVIHRLAHARQPGTQGSLVEEKYSSAMRGAYPAIADVQQTLTYQSPLHGSYTSAAFSRRLRNIAMSVRRMSLQGSSERHVFVLGLGGYDTHSRWLADTPGIMATLAQGLGTFMADLNAMGVADNVVVVTGTEFGRTIASNGVGTDHGNGSTTMVMGGRIRGGASSVYGDILTQSEFANLPAAPARIDNRGIISSILNNFMGVDHTKAFPGPISSEFSIENYDLFT